jgi:hypothetical protein
VEALDAYVKEKLTYSADMAPLFATTMTTSVIDLPGDLAPGAGDTMKMIFAEEVKEYVKRSRVLASNIATLFAVTRGRRASRPTKAAPKSLQERLFLVVATDQVNRAPV